jgi:TolA-binding protein
MGTISACSAGAPPAPPQAPVAVEAVAPVPRGATPAATFAIGYRLIKQRDYGQARPVLESIRDYEPLHDYVLFYLGLACARSGASAQALALWTELVDQYPQSLLASEGSRGNLYPFISIPFIFYWFSHLCIVGNISILIAIYHKKHIDIF